MLEGLRFLVLGRHWTQILHDVIDILIVAFIVYRALIVLRGTRAMQMGVGFVIFGLLYLLAKYAEFITLLNVLSMLASSLILIVVVVFQNDIRRALIRMGARAWFRGAREQQTRVIDEAVDAATELARHRIGAIIAFERDANLLEFVRSEGIVLDSLVSRELLVSLFLPESLNKTHDGAVLIRNLRIARAGMFFPMPESRIADPSFGSRHRAAIGITEETDAVVVVVSEERGTVTLCFGGSYVANIDASNLRKTLLEQLGHPKGERKPFMQRLGSGLRRSKGDEPAEERAPSTARTPAVRASATKASVTEPASATSTTEKRKAGAAASASKDKSKASAAEEEDAAASTTTPRRATKSTIAAQPTPGEVEVTEKSKTPPPSRVSKPMPQPKERKSNEPSSSEAASDGSSGRKSVTKSMMPTEMPSTSAPPGGDEP